MKTREKYALVLFILAGIGTGYLAYYSATNDKGWLFFYNTWGILLEIVGFILVLTAEKKLILKRGGFTSDHYEDPETDTIPEEILGVPVPGYYNLGVIIVIAGLVFQLLGLATNLQ